MEVKNIVRNGFGTIDCEINHRVYGWIPTTLSPDDCVEGNVNLYHEIIEGLHGEIDESRHEELKADIAADYVRKQRNVLLEEADVLVKIAEDSRKKLKATREYRQALRDITEQEGFPFDVQWPEKP